MKANQKFRSFKEDTSGFAKIMGGLVALLVAILVGVLVFWELNDGLDYTINGEMPGNPRATANSTNTTAGTIFSLLPIAAIVVVASIILAVVTRFGAGGSGL